jgi:hypothetical protein
MNALVDALEMDIYRVAERARLLREMFYTIRDSDSTLNVREVSRGLAVVADDILCSAEDAQEQLTKLLKAARVDARCLTDERREGGAR